MKQQKRFKVSSHVERELFHSGKYNKRIERDRTKYTRKGKGSTLDFT